MRIQRAILLGPTETLRSVRDSLKALGVRRRGDFLVGVDNGAERWIRLGFSPDFAVGDWDSLKRVGILRDVPHVSLPRKKDRSDLYYAIREVLGRGAREIVCLGVTGARADHHLAMLLDLAGVAGDARICAVGAEAEYYFVRVGRWVRRGLRRGQLVSVFSVGGVARGVTLRGFQYGLTGGVLKPSSHGLSNGVTSGVCEVRVKSGTLVVVIPK